MIAIIYKRENGICIKDFSDVTYGRRPSSNGSHVSVISVDPIAVFWCRPTILLWIRGKQTDEPILQSL